MRTLLLSLALLSPLAIASHTPVGWCESYSAPSLGIVEITVGAADGTFYVDDRGGSNVWVYEETNDVWTSHGLPGVYRDDLAQHNLQRGGASIVVPDDSEICVDDFGVIPDTLLY